jgi:glyoxylase-like metal-dependent hydrolase (beta-lactamase superfamily II)
MFMTGFGIRFSIERTIGWLHGRYGRSEGHIAPGEYISASQKSEGTGGLENFGSYCYSMIRAGEAHPPGCGFSAAAVEEVTSMRFAVGAAIVDVIVDIDDFPLPLADFLPGIDVDRLLAHRDSLEPDFLDLAGNALRFAIQSFVIRLNGRTILIDACVGEAKQRPELAAFHQRQASGFLQRLANVGVRAEDIDTVFCTHLHVDHVGWNTQRADGRWVPTFPRARHLFGRLELADWMTRRAAGTVPPLHLASLEDSVIPVVEAKLVDLVDDGFELAPGLTLTQLPGHTDGQMGLQIDLDEGRAIFCGDAIHSPVQLLQPDVSTATCANPQTAAATRRAVLDEANDSGRLVVPAHFRGRRCCRVRRQGTGFEPVFNHPAPA